MLPLTRKSRQHFRCMQIPVTPLSRDILLHVNTTHHRYCALKRVFPGWKAYVVLRRHKKAQTTLADQHFRSTALPKYTHC